MKKPVIIWVSALTLLTLSATLFAQTTTGSSLITQMKAATHAFTLAADLNPGATGLQSAPVWGKKTGDMLTAGEYNRILELVGQGGGGGGGAWAVFRVRLANNYNTGDNVPAVVHWDTEDFDEGEQFDMTTHSFKPKSAWYYFLSATVCYEDLNASNGTGSDQVAVFISKNWAASLAEIGVNYFQGTNIVTYNGLTDPCVIVSGVVSSDGDDSFAVRAFQDDVNPTPIRAGSLFSGFQIGGGGGTWTGGGGSGWVDVSATTTPFDLNCEYKWKVPDFVAPARPESFVANRINLEHISADFSAGNYQLVNASNKRSSTGDHGTFAAQTFQRCDSGGGGTGGGPIVKQISGSTPPKSSNYIALCNDNTTVPTMTGYGPLPVYWNSTTQKWIGRRIEIPTAGSGANVSGYMFDCPSLWIAE